MRRLIIALTLLVLLAPVAQADWAQENAQPANHGQATVQGPASLDGPRSYDAGARILTQIIEGPAGLAVAATLEGRIVALDATTEPAWSTDVAGELRTAPLWTGQHVIAVPRSGEAIALDALGQEAWRVPIGNDRDTVNGEPIVLIRMASPVSHPSGDTIIADLEGQVQRVDSDGQVAWQADLGGQLAIEATPAMTSTGDVIVAGFVPGTEGEGTLARIDGESGEITWEQAIGSQVVGAPAIAGDQVLVPLRDGDALQAHALSDGSEAWRVAFNDHLTSSPVVRGGLAVVGDIAGLIQAIQLSDQSIAWTFNARDEMDQLLGSQTLTVADSFAVGQDGRLWVPYWNADLSTCCPPRDSDQSPFYLLDHRTGDIQDQVQFDKALHGPALHATGAWAGGDDGGLRHWATPGSLGVHALVDGPTVTLLTNTATQGPWEIQWGDGETKDGQGSLPLTHTHTYAPGQHTLSVDTLAGTDSITITIPGEPEGDDQASQPQQPDPNASTRQAPAATDEEPDTESPAEETTDGTPLGLWAALLALVVAAGRSRRG